MNINEEPIQLGLLPDMDVLMSSLPQRSSNLLKHTHKHKQDSSKVAQRQVLPGHDQQSQPDSTIAQGTFEWEQSQEFTISAGGRSVRVNFEPFYFRASSFSKGTHHFEFHGETISPTGYRSDFLHHEETISWMSPLDYAIQKSQELNAELLKEQKKLRRNSKSKAH